MIKMIVTIVRTTDAYWAGAKGWRVEQWNINRKGRKS